MTFRGGQNAKSKSRHKREGTFRADRHAAMVDDRDFAGDLPDRPGDLSPVEAEIWGHVVETTPAGILRRIDESELIGMVHWYGEYRRCMDEARRTSIAAKKYYRLIQMATMAWKHFAAAASRFGMTPADRARLKTMPAKTKEADDPLESLKLLGAKAS